MTFTHDPLDVYHSKPKVPMKTNQWLTHRKKVWAARAFLVGVSGLIITGLVILALLTKRKTTTGHSFLDSHYVALQVYAIAGISIVGAVLLWGLLIFCVDILPEIFNKALENSRR